MPSGYESIPPGEEKQGSTFFKITCAICTVAFLGVFTYLAGATSDAVAATESGAKAIPTADVADSGEPWPSHFIKLGMLYQPMDTTEAKEKGWKPSGEDCVPSLGEPWIYGDERSSNTSSTFFYTPAVGDVPGVLSGIEVDYYNYNEEKLIAEFFSEERTSKDGSYYSIALALRDSSKQDLCDTTSTIAYPNEEYLAIAPDKANMLIPLSESSADLKENYHEGSCLPGMGNHWETDIVGGKDITFEAGNLNPVVPMYNSTDGTINGVFFVIPQRKQFWLPGCNAFAVPVAPECLVEANFWDIGPGLSEVNAPPFFLCSNFCGKCQFSGSADGMYATMHIFFRPMYLEKCDDMKPSCANGKSFGSF